MRKSLLSVAFALVAAASLVGLADRAEAELQKVSFLKSADAFFLILQYVAQDKGFFAEEGIEIEPVMVQTGTQEVAAVMNGSADVVAGGLQNVVNAAANGGDVIAIGRMFDVVPNATALSLAAIQRVGITDAMSTAEKLKRMHGLQIGVSSPGSSTDKVLRSMFVVHGMDADTEITIKPMGGPQNLLAALQQGAIDGLVYSAPVSEIAVQMKLAKIVIDPLKGDVPEFQDSPFCALTTSRATLEKKRPQLLAVVRAITKAMKFSGSNLEEVRTITRQHFLPLGDDVFRNSFDTSVKGIPSDPELTQHQFDKLLAWVNLTEKKPKVAKYSDVVYPNLAQEAATDILAK